MPDALQSSVSFIGLTPLLFVVVDVKAMHIFPRLRCRGMVGMMIPVCLANSDGMTSSLAMSYQRVLYLHRTLVPDTSAWRSVERQQWLELLSSSAWRN